MIPYPIEIVKDDNGSLLITCPALPEVTTFAESADEVDWRATDAIEEAIAARIADSREVPLPTGTFKHVVQLASQVGLKVNLYRALASEQITRAELGRRLQWKREQVDRLFRLDHATRLDQYDAAFNALGRNIMISARRGQLAGDILKRTQTSRPPRRRHQRRLARQTRKHAS